MERNERDGGVIKHTITLAILATVAALTLAGCHEPTPDKAPPNAIDVRLVAPHLCDGHARGKVRGTRRLRFDGFCEFAAHELVE